MSSDKLNQRVKRIYAALAGVKEQDLAKFPPKVVDANGVVLVWQDFRGGASDADLSNAAHLLIHNIAHLEDHVRQWAKRSGVDTSEAQSALQGSRAFVIIKDLSNNDKHGYPPRDGGRSGISPRVEQFRRTLRLTTKPEKGSSVAVVLTPQGVRQVGGSGTSQVLITGDVVDGNGNKVGDLHDLASEAVEAIEASLRNLGIKLPV